MTSRTRAGAAQAARWTVVLLAVGAALVAGCDSATAPPEDGVPDAFEFIIGGFGVGSTGVQLRGDTIVTTRVPWDYDGTQPVDSARLVPTAEAWRTFWATVRTSGVHRWRSRYDAPHIVDGTGWTLRLRSGSFAADSQGSNAYPDSQGRRHEGEATDGFRQLLAAVHELTGGAANLLWE